jgi:hypothetical protein
LYPNRLEEQRRPKRSLPKTEALRIFEATGGPKVLVVNHNGSISYFTWSLIANHLTIGCRFFNKADTAKIREWALWQE